MAKSVEREVEEGELEILRNKVKELSKEIDRYGSKLAKKTSIPRKKKNKYLWTLVVLIVIIIIVDVLAVVAYYKPDFSKLMKPNNSNSTNNQTNSGKKCIDGTLEGACSRNKPLFCYKGQLIKKAFDCGCTAGYKRDFQDCVKI